MADPQIDWYTAVTQPQIGSAPQSNAAPDTASVDWYAAVTGAPSASSTVTSPSVPAGAKPSGFFDRIGDALEDALIGSKRREPNIPELPDRSARSETPATGSIPPGHIGRVIQDMGGAPNDQTRMALGRSNAERTDIYRKAHPDAQSRKDQWGNTIVTGDDGKEYYLNSPGFSPQDLREAVVETGPMMIGGGLGGMAGRAALAPAGVGAIGRIAGAGAGMGAGSLAQDMAAGEAGSKQGPDFERAALTAGVGAAGEAVLSPFVQKLYRAIFRQPELYADGVLTDTGQRLIREAGIDPVGITPEFGETFNRIGRTAADPRAAIAKAEAESLPTPVRLSSGNLSLNPLDQMTESLSRKGAYGQGASDVMRGADDAAREAIEGNRIGIQDRLSPSGVSTVADQRLAGQNAQERLASMEQTEKAGVNQAYNTARATDATVRPEGITDLRDAMKSALQDYEPEFAPKTFAVINRGAGQPVKAEASTLLDANGQPMRAATETVSPALVRDLETKRRQLSTVARESSDATERGAAGKAVKAYDEQLGTLLEKDLISGDETAIQAWRDARSTNREFAGRFRGNDVVSKLVERDPRSGQYQFVVPPDQASTAIFGAAKLFGGGNTGRDLMRVKDLLGAESPEWQQLREAAWLRLFDAGRGGELAEGARGFSGANFGKALDGAQKDAPLVMSTLFTPEEQALMQQFRRVASRTTVRVAGGDNTSNSAVAAMPLLQKMAASLLFNENAAARMAAIPGLRSVYNGLMTARALRASRGAIDQIALPPGTGGILANEGEHATER